MDLHEQSNKIVVKWFEVHSADHAALDRFSKQFKVMEAFRVLGAGLAQGLKSH